MPQGDQLSRHAPPTTHRGSAAGDRVPAWKTRTAWTSFAVLAGAQVSLALVDDPGAEERLASVVVVAFAATVLLVLARRLGGGRAGAALVTTVALTLTVEWIGHTTGVPFGQYDYTGALAPSVAGVPVIVPLAWFAMGATALELGHQLARSATGAVVLGALGLTAWDLFLDPQMVDAGYWEWADPGRYHGIPWTNYAGWFATGLVVLGALHRLRPPAQQPSTALLALYAWWTIAYVFAFVVFFGSVGVAVVGGLAMGGLSVAGWRSWRRARAGEATWRR